MEFSPLIVFVTSAALFVVLVMYVQAERKSGKRFILSRMRGAADVSLVKFNAWLKRQWKHFVRYFLQLGWYYSLHSFLRTIMAVLVAAYDFLEAHFERNRTKTKHLRAEKRQHIDTHFSAVAEHKAEMALTPKQQEKLREKKLEEKH